MEDGGVVQAHYDPEADTATIYLWPQLVTARKHSIAHTQPCNPAEFDGRISPLHLHFDAADQLLAIEVSDASRTLPEEFLTTTEPETVRR